MNANYEHQEAPHHERRPERHRQACWASQCPGPRRRHAETTGLKQLDELAGARRSGTTPRQRGASTTGRSPPQAMARGSSGQFCRGTGCR